MYEFVTVDHHAGIIDHVGVGEASASMCARVSGGALLPELNPSFVRGGLIGIHAQDGMGVV